MRGGEEREGEGGDNPLQHALLVVLRATITPARIQRAPSGFQTVGIETETWPLFHNPIKTES